MRRLKRKTKDQFLMSMALTAKQQACCTGRSVGAVVVKNGVIVATGYNGTPEGYPNCDEGGCYRCSNKHLFKPGEGYDLCVCVHAEQNCIASAARYGPPIDGGRIYTTLLPCLGCCKLIQRAGIVEIVYLDGTTKHQNPDVEEQWKRALSYFKVRQLEPF